MEPIKPFSIDKMHVWQAYQDVKQKGSAAGIDEETIKDFEENLKDNLYKIWNRMSSGTYFPPAVKVVPIPKKSGGIPVLGIPTVSDRIAQRVVKSVLEALLVPLFDEALLDIVPLNRHLMPLRLQESAAGSMIGLLNLILKVYSTTLIMIY
jgi:RNA-directed DNA polymerase